MPAIGKTQLGYATAIFALSCRLPCSYLAAQTFAFYVQSCLQCMKPSCFLLLVLFVKSCVFCILSMLLLLAPMHQAHEILVSAAL